MTILAVHLVKNVNKLLCIDIKGGVGLWPAPPIFIKQEANDIHYLDSSLLSSCLQIEVIFADKELEEDDDNFELF